MISLGSMKKDKPYIVEAETMSCKEISIIITLANMKISTIIFLLDALTLHSLQSSG